MFISTYELPGNIMTLNVNGIIRIFSFLDFLPMGHVQSNFEPAG